MRGVTSQRVEFEILGKVSTFLAHLSITIADELKDGETPLGVAVRAMRKSDMNFQDLIACINSRYAIRFVVDAKNQIRQLPPCFDSYLVRTLPSGGKWRQMYLDDRIKLQSVGGPMKLPERSSRKALITSLRTVVFHLIQLSKDLEIHARLTDPYAARELAIELFMSLSDPDVYGGFGRFTPFLVQHVGREVTYESQDSPSLLALIYELRKLYHMLHYTSVKPKAYEDLRQALMPQIFNDLILPGCLPVYPRLKRIVDARIALASAGWGWVRVTVNEYHSYLATVNQHLTADWFSDAYCEGADMDVRDVVVTKYQAFHTKTGQVLTPPVLHIGRHDCDLEVAASKAGQFKRFEWIFDPLLDMYETFLKNSPPLSESEKWPVVRLTPSATSDSTVWRNPYLKKIKLQTSEYIGPGLPKLTANTLLQPCLAHPNRLVPSYSRPDESLEQSAAPPDLAEHPFTVHRQILNHWCDIRREHGVDVDLASLINMLNVQPKELTLKYTGGCTIDGRLNLKLACPWYKLDVKPISYLDRPTWFFSNGDEKALTKLCVFSEVLKQYFNLAYPSVDTVIKSIAEKLEKDQPFEPAEFIKSQQLELEVSRMFFKNLNAKNRDLIRKMAKVKSKREACIAQGLYTGDCADLELSVRSIQKHFHIRKLNSNHVVVSAKMPQPNLRS